ncbi:MAG TPA: EF-hand domain-containing protein [Xanthobacteraceae bacterium]|nr:EF-hand domain-containing protein [Xanthobacteraceae bacterium]
MISRRQAIAVVVTALIGAATPARAKNSTLVGQFDTDNDGTVDLAEAKKAASAMFDKLDTDHDGTLDFKELHGRLSHREFAAADPDKDGTLTKDEYLAVVERRFKTADTDHDGTLSNWEFHTPKGRALARLLR